MTELKAGVKLKSAVCNAEIMVIKAPAAARLTCGGVAMRAATDAGDKTTGNAEQMSGCQIGKRYVNADQSLEVLCVKAGEGSLAADGELLSIKDAKKLPSSD